MCSACVNHCFKVSDFLPNHQIKSFAKVSCYMVLTRIQSSGPTPSTVTASECLLRTNFIAVEFVLVAMVTGTCQSADSKPTVQKRE